MQIKFHIIVKIYFTHKSQFMATENKIKFVQEMVFSISSKKLQRVLARMRG